MKKNLVGIVPVSGINADFNLPWHASLMPLSPNYLAVERAVAECAYAGCSTIWIVCNDDVTPLIRYQVGEKIQDPVYNYRHFEINKNDVKKPIRIYYVPLAIRDLGKRDSISWSAIYGCQVANKIMSSISSHLKPDKFYIAWPFGYYDPRLARQHRKDIASGHVLFTHSDRSVQENNYLGFTLDIEQIKLLVKESVTTSSGLWTKDRAQKLPLQERYSYKNYTLKEVFSSLESTRYKKIPVKDYFCIDSWEKYCEFISSYRRLKKPSVLKYSEWSEIGVDD